MSDRETEYVLVSEYFYPDTASSGKLMTDLAVGLKERGLDVTVYTGQPNYHSYEDAGRARRETHEGVPVVRTRVPQLRQTSFVRRLVNWGLFTVATFFGLLFSAADGDREIVFVSNPPFASVPLWLVCRIRRWEYTYIVHDLYPDQPVEIGYLEEGGVIDRLWSALQTRVYLDAKAVVTNGPVMCARISENTDGRVSEEEITVIHNWEDGDLVRPRADEDNWFARANDLVDPFVVLYSGNIGMYHEFETVLKAAAAFEDREVKFVIVGEGDNKENVVRSAKELGVYGSTVEFLPFQPREVLPFSVAAGDVHLVTVREGFEGVNLSLKMYTAMAAGKPALVVAHPSDDESLLVDEHDIGKHVSQGDVAGVVEAIEEWRSNPGAVRKQGRSARRAFERHYTKDRAIEKYYRLFAHGPESVEDSFPYEPAVRA